MTEQLSLFQTPSGRSAGTSISSESKSKPPSSLMLVGRRNALALAPANFLTARIEKDQAPPLFSLNVVFQAAHPIEAMSRRAWKKHREQGRS